MPTLTKPQKENLIRAGIARAAKKRAGAAPPLGDAGRDIPPDIAADVTPPVSQPQSAKLVNTLQEIVSDHLQSDTGVPPVPPSAKQRRAQSALEAMSADLESLSPDPLRASAPPRETAPAAPAFSVSAFQHLPISAVPTAHILRSPWNRSHFDPEKERELIESIRERGVLQPGLARPITPAMLEQLTLMERLQVEEAQKDGRAMVQLVAGERRWRAASVVGCLMPLIIREMSDAEALEIQAAENLHREDLNAIEKAEKFQQLLEEYGRAGIKRDDAIQRICERLQLGDQKLSRSTVYDSLRLLKLPELVKDAVKERRLPPSHAGEIAKLEHDPEIQAEVASLVLRPSLKHEQEEGILSFRATKALVAERLKFIENRKTWRAECEKALERGDKVLTGKESWEIVDSRDALDGMDHWWFIGRGKEGKYVKGDEWPSIPGAEYRPYKQLWKKAPPGILALLPNGKPVTFYEKEVADKAVREGGKLKTAKNSAKPSEEVARERRHKARTHVFRQVVGDIVRSECEKKESAASLRLLAQFQWRALSSDAYKRIKTRRGWEVERSGSIAKFTAPMSEGDLRGLLLEMAMQQVAAPSSWVEKWDAGFVEACKQFGIDLAAKMKEVQTSGQGREGSPQPSQKSAAEAAQQSRNRGRTK